MRKSGTVLLAACLAIAALGATGNSSAAKSRSSPKTAANKTAAKKSAPTAQSSKSAAGASTKSPSSKKVATKPADTGKAARAESAASRREELRGIWITTDQPRDWDALMRKLKDSGLNAAFVRVAQGGKAIYPSKILPQDQWAAELDEDELANAVAAAHRHGIQFHAWKVCFPMGAAKFRPPGSEPHAFYEKIAAEDRLVRTAKGVQAPWLNPSDPRNHDLEIRVAGEIVEQYAVDGYHLDYIRYPASADGGEPGFDAHYDNVSRREFEKTLGRPVKNWPDDVASGPLKLEFEDWERDNLTSLVKRLRGEVRSKRPGTLLSAAVWRKVHLYRSWIRQDWPRWCREGLLDFVVPMCYEKDLDEFRTVLSRDFTQVCGRVPFMAGIGNYRLYSADSLVDQVQAARELGADGFVLFSINDPTDETNPKVYYKGLVDRQLAALAAGLTKSDAAPGVGGPHMEFALSSSVLPRRYQSLAAEAGAVNQVTIRLPKSPGATGELRLAACIEDLKGRRIGDVQTITLKPGGEQTLPVVAGLTAVRPIVRGSVGQGSAVRPFVLRGPIVEPVSSSEYAELRARQLPPVMSGSGIKVGVYFNGLGAGPIVESIGEVDGITAVPIYRLESSHLAPLDVLVLPQLYELADLTPKSIKAIRGWVEGGGRLIVTRDAVGLRWHPRLFPEVGVGTELTRNKSVQLAASLRGFAKGTRFDHEFKDHAQLAVKSTAKVLLAETKTGKPVVASGKIGKGTVILNGLVPGNEEESDPNSQSMRFLVALVDYR
jgi:uncharacterized lipoprotein YddW (UPF0748 family)